VETLLHSLVGFIVLINIFILFEIVSIIIKIDKSFKILESDIVILFNWITIVVDIVSIVCFLSYWIGKILF